MKRRIYNIIGLCSLCAVACIGASGQHRGAAHPVADGPSFNSISRREVELLLRNVGEANPKMLERLAAEPALKQEQLDNLKQLLAYASQAQREGLAAQPTNKQELENIRAEILALNYDRQINPQKGPQNPFSGVTEAQITSYWADKTGPRTHESEFQDFLNAKLAILRASDPAAAANVPDDEMRQARDIFAKIRISKAAYERNARAGKLAAPFIEMANLEVKLQQAQFLARIYGEKIADRMAASDAEITGYIAGHPALDTSAKRARAEQILTRAKTGEDFAALANEFSDDPGNKGTNGELQGGLYQNVPEGTMVRPFEEAALGLEPGQVDGKLVETDFGFHIIKLEKKSTATDARGNSKQVYDVRHILVSTMVPDPADPNGRVTPIRDHVRKVIESDKEAKLVDKMVADNHIQVPTDFTVPTAAAGAQAGPAVKAPANKKRPAAKRRH